MSELRRDRDRDEGQKERDCAPRTGEADRVLARRDQGIGCLFAQWLTTLRDRAVINV